MLTVTVSILINKDMCEPSYNDLKFQVRNLNDFGSNLTFAFIISSSLEDPTIRFNFLIL